MRKVEFSKHFFNTTYKDFVTRFYNTIIEMNKWNASISGSSLHLISNYMEITKNTYESVLLFTTMASKRQKRVEYYFTIPPLTRTFVDMLCNIIFIFENCPERIDMHNKAFYRSFKEEVDFYINEFGQDSTWIDYINENKSILSEISTGTILHNGKKTKLKGIPLHEIKYWPIPSKMVPFDKKTKKYSYVLSDDRRRIINVLKDWFYGGLSEQSHVKSTGVYLRSMLDAKVGKTREIYEKKVANVASKNLIEMTAFINAIFTEINAEWYLGYEKDLDRYWKKLLKADPYFEHLYNIRYKNLL